MYENELATRALDICFELHKRYGPGMYESVYEELFCYEWRKTGIPFTRQQTIPLQHEELRIAAAFRADVILAEKVILEIKSVEALTDIHFKQVRTYLQLTGLHLGILINFNVPMLRDGIRRIANNL